MTNINAGCPNLGRVLYSTPVPIWDNTTGNVANIVTSFSFDVLIRPAVEPGDGLIFFLTDPKNINIHENSIRGLLGVADAKNAFSNFVGVEFDNFVDPWDPNYAHIEIDLNSLYSAKYVKWDWFNGVMLKVKIVYNSLSSTLNVVVTDNDRQTYKLSQMLDLKCLLPPTALVGISASSGVNQMHHLYSWSFTSSLDTTTTRSSSYSINNNTIANYAS